MPSENGVAEVRDDAEVVGYENHAEAVFRAEFTQQVENFRLDGHVQGGGGLLRDDQIRTGRDRAADQDALCHSAGDLVRVKAEDMLRVLDPDPREKGQYLAPGFPSSTSPRSTPMPTPMSVGRPSSADVVDGAGGEADALGGEEGDEFGHFLRASDALHRDEAGDVVQHLG